MLVNFSQGVLTISSLISLGMMANMSLMDRSEMACETVMLTMLREMSGSVDCIRASTDPHVF